MSGRFEREQALRALTGLFDEAMRELRMFLGRRAVDRPAAALPPRRRVLDGCGEPRRRVTPRRAHPFDLTVREQQVLDALALGLSNAQIAGRLFVSPKTVDHHVSAILGKLGVPSRGAAVAHAHRHGLLTRPGPA